MEPIQDLQEQIDFLEGRIEDIESNCRKLASENKEIKHKLPLVNQENVKILQDVTLIKKEKERIQSKFQVTRRTILIKVTSLNDKIFQVSDEKPEYRAIKCFPL